MCLLIICTGNKAWQHSHLQRSSNNEIFVLENIGFSPNGEGENRILNPEGKNSCPSGEAAWARILA